MPLSLETPKLMRECWQITLSEFIRLVLPGNRLTVRPCETGLWRGDTKFEIRKF
jgi:hypothetical protein